MDHVVNTVAQEVKEEEKVQTCMDCMYFQLTEEASLRCKRANAEDCEELNVGDLFTMSSCVVYYNVEQRKPLVCPHFKES